MERLSSPTPAADTGEPVVRRMRLGDLRRVVSLEREAFGTPWSYETFASLLERPAAELWVLEVGSDPAEVVGYAVVWCILDQGEVANIAVAPEHRGRGLGRLLLDRMVGLAAERGVETLYLEVRVSNAPARALYERAGFGEVGRRAGYYEAPVEDALVLRKVLDRG